MYERLYEALCEGLHEAQIERVRFGHCRVNLEYDCR